MDNRHNSNQTNPNKQSNPQNVLNPSLLSFYPRHPTPLIPCSCRADLPNWLTFIASCRHTQLTPPSRSPLQFVPPFLLSVAWPPLFCLEFFWSPVMVADSGWPPGVPPPPPVTNTIIHFSLFHL